MPKSNRFVLPRGVTLTTTGESVWIKHDGDVELEDTLGRRLASLEARGDIIARTDCLTGDVQAGGLLHVDCPAKADTLRGTDVVVGPYAVQCRAIVATRRIEIEAAQLSVDILSAPEIRIHDDATGRVTIIDCASARPATRIRGGWSVEDYELEVGDVRAYLSARGVEPVSTLPEPSAPPVREAPPPEPVTRAPEPLRVAPAVKAVEPPPVPAAPPPEPPAVEPPSVVPVFEDDVTPPEAFTPDPPTPTPVAPEPAARFQHPPGALRGTFRKALQRIDQVYGDGGAPVPTPIDLLRDLAAADEYDRIGAELDTIWCDVLRDHLRRKQAPPLPVVQAFLSLNALRA